MTTKENVVRSAMIRPGWNSTIAIVLVISWNSYPEFWPLWIFLWLICVVRFRSPIFWICSLGMGLRLFLLSPPTIPLEPVSPLVQGTVQECIRTSKGFRIKLDASSHHQYLVRSDRPMLPGTDGSFTIRWDNTTPMTVPGAFSTRKWLKSQNVVASGLLLDAKTTSSGWCVERYAFQAREWLRTLSLSYMSKETAGIMVALLVGDKSGLTEETSLEFRNTGLVHILTVSGFHIVFLSSFLQMMLACARVPRKFLGWMTIALLIVFIPITGSSPAVQRAVFMFLLVHCAKVVERSPLSLHTLGVASSLILFWEPEALWDIGFQLSCGATAGILFGQKSRPEWLKRLPGFMQSWILEPTWITLCATVGTFPFLIFHFQSFPPITFIGNLIIAPLMGFAMEAGVLLVLSCFLSPLASGFGQAASILLDISVSITSKLSHFAGAACAMGPWPIWICLVLLAFGFCFLRIRGSGRFHQILLLGLSLSWLAWSIYEKPILRIHFLDAGQGDCTFLHFPNGKALMVDAGNGSRQGQYGKRLISPFLRSQGVSTLDALIITHPDLDHFGGGISLMENSNINSIWISFSARICEKPEWQVFLQKAREHSIPLYTLQPGMEFTGLGDYRLRWLWAGGDSNTEDWNQTSATFILSDSTRNLLFAPGDLAIREENEILSSSILWSGIRMQADILKLGHHGSKHSTGDSLLRLLQPTYAVVSSGKMNRYGHPHQEVLTRLEDARIPWNNTAYSGTVSVTWQRNRLDVQLYSDSATIFSLPIPPQHH